jgi:hypothetical protein
LRRYEDRPSGGPTLAASDRSATRAVAISLKYSAVGRAADVIFRRDPIAALSVAANRPARHRAES